MAAVIVINLVFTFVGPALGTGSISWQGHVGSLVIGAAVAAAYVHAPQQHRNAIQAGVSVAILVLFIALIAVRTNYLLASFGLS